MQVSRSSPPTALPSPEPSLRRAGAAVALPRWLYLPALLGTAFVLLPLAAIVARVDWANFGSLVTSESSLDALRLSLKTSVASTVACLVIGVPMAALLARHDGRLVGVLRSLVLIPLVLPPVVS